VSRAYAIAPMTAVVESLRVDDQWKPLCIPVRVDSGQVIYVVGDTAFLYYPHECKLASPGEIVGICLALVVCFVIGLLILKPKGVRTE
jgi:hypothetical protein